MRLNDTQGKILDILEVNQENPLSMRQIADELGIGSTSTIHHHIKQLEKKGYLKRNLSNPRDYKIFREPQNAVTHLPFYGLARCGPNGNPLQGDVKEYIPISTKLFSSDPDKTILLEAYGDSMEPSIHEGDYIVVDTSAKSGNGEMALCVLLEGNNVTEVLIKKVSAHPNHYVLQSMNDKYKDIEVDKTELNVVGQIKGVICTGH